MTAKFSYDNPTFSSYAFYASILILKMFFVAFTTIVSNNKVSIGDFIRFYHIYGNNRNNYRSLIIWPLPAQLNKMLGVAARLRSYTAKFTNELTKVYV